MNTLGKRALVWKNYRLESSVSRSVLGDAMIGLRVFPFLGNPHRAWRGWLMRTRFVYPMHTGDEASAA